MRVEKAPDLPYSLNLISVTDRTGEQTYSPYDGLGSTANVTD